MKMSETTILCKDCEAERRRIENSGDSKVVSCNPLPGEEDKPEDERRRCKLIWKDNPLLSNQQV